MGWWNNIWRTQAQTWIFEWLDPSQIPGTPASQPVKAENAYLSVRLASMRVVNVRKSLSTFYGTVHSHISIPHLSGKPASFDVVTTPSALQKVDAKHMDRLIPVNKRLLGPVPYRGGDLEMEVGLFSVKQADLAAPYLDLLATLSEAAGVSYIKAALPFAAPLQKGIQLLTGSDSKDILEIGIAYSSKSPQTGYYLVMRAPKGTMNVRTLRVTSPDNYLVDAAGKSVGDYPYMLIEISASLEREAWFEIPELQNPYAALKEAVRARKVDEVQERFATFKFTVLTSDDLLHTDARKIVDGVDQWLKDILGTGPLMTGADIRGESRNLPDLSELRIY